MFDDQETHTTAFYREHYNKLKDIVARVHRLADRTDDNVGRKIANDMDAHLKTYFADFLTTGNGHDK